MKKSATLCLILLATLFAGCNATNNSFVKALDAGADPTAITSAPAAGASTHIAQAGQSYACRAMQSRNSAMFCSK